MRGERMSEKREREMKKEGKDKGQKNLGYFSLFIRIAWYIKCGDIVLDYGYLRNNYFLKYFFIFLIFLT
jgi:hypothetical protein